MRSFRAFVPLVLLATMASASEIDFGSLDTFPPPGTAGLALCAGEDPCGAGEMAYYDADLADECWRCTEDATYVAGIGVAADGVRVVAGFQIEENGGGTITWGADYLHLAPTAGFGAVFMSIDADKVMLDDLSLTSGSGEDLVIYSNGSGTEVFVRGGSESGGDGAFVRLASTGGGGGASLQSDGDSSTTNLVANNAAGVGNSIIIANPSITYPSDESGAYTFSVAAGEARPFIYLTRFMSGGIVGEGGGPADGFTTSLLWGAPAADRFITLPIDDPVEGDVLTTDDDGVTRWDAPSVAANTILVTDEGATSVVAVEIHGIDLDVIDAGGGVANIQIADDVVGLNELSDTMDFEAEATTLIWNLNPSSGGVHVMRVAVADETDTWPAILFQNTDVSAPTAQATGIKFTGEYLTAIDASATAVGAAMKLGDNTLEWEGVTADGFETTVRATDPTADRAILLPDGSGTIAVHGAGTETLANAGFANTIDIDLFIPNDLGVEGDIFTDVGVTIGASTVITDGSIVNSSGNFIITSEGTADDHEVSLTFADATGSDKTVTVPNATGTIVLNDNTASLTEKTFDAAASGNVLKFKQTATLLASDIHECYAQTADTDTAATFDTVHSTTGNIIETVGALFLDANDYYMVCRLQLPSDLDASADMRMRLTAVALADGAAGDADFEMQAKAIAHGEDSSGAWGSNRGTSAGEIDIPMSATNDVIGQSSWFTMPAGPYAADDVFYMRIRRDGNDATHDDYAGSVLVTDVQVEYTVSQ